MPSLREPGRNPVFRAIAHVIIAAVVTAIPKAAEASVPASETDKLTKSAFGELLSHDGTDTQPYAFAGEPLDPNVGFQHHRARWLDPRAGRFASMDPWGGEIGDPRSRHSYSYAAGDPVRLADPSGLFFTIGTMMLNLSMMNTINAISVPNPTATVSQARSVTIWLRLFAPWKRFGLVFAGDNRSFSTFPSVTSRVQAYVKFNEINHTVFGYSAWSDPSHDIYGRTARATPTVSVTATVGSGIELSVAASNPLVPSPDIDAKLSFFTGVGGGGRTCYSGDLSGDAFPNAEVFVERSSVRTMLHTFTTAGGPESGPAQYLPDNNGRNMGHFFQCF